MIDLPLRAVNAPGRGVRACGALAITGTPFGFMAFLEIASPVGVIVSHVTVLSDFIGERHAEWEPLVDALPGARLDALPGALPGAGIARLRPVV